MKNVAILTDFVSHDPAYSLCGVVSQQVKMLGKVRVLARHKDEAMRLAYGDDVWLIDPGEIGNNVVNVTPESEKDIAGLFVQLCAALDGIDVVLTHDLIYQANMWKYHVACRRIARERPDLKWLHWVHSASAMNTADQCGKYSNELSGKFPNSRLVVMHREELVRKGGQFGYEIDEVSVIPNAIDLTDGYDKAALDVIGVMDLWRADVVGVYPCRLDRGKQIEIPIEIFGGLRSMGKDARLVVVDFHSTAGDKAVYRQELEALAESLGVHVLFTSRLTGNEYHIPHKAVMDLFEYGDILIHPSTSESDPLIVPEAAWKRCGLVLNFDLPVFRQYDGLALFGKFSSSVDVLTGLAGNTSTKYGDRAEYMKEMAAKIAYVMENNPVLNLHAKVRKERSPEGVWNKYLRPAIEGI